MYIHLKNYEGLTNTKIINTKKGDVTKYIFNGVYNLALKMFKYCFNS